MPVTGKCIACLQGFEWECLWNGKCDVVAGISTTTISPVPSISVGKDIVNLELPEEDTDESVEVTIREQDGSSLKDQQSTGRKRAAKMYPLDREAPCDFQGKKSCGGGNHPIVGCIAGKQQARHHGPDKNTLNNGPTNVHRICHECHNRWHAQNDPGYVWGSSYPAHAPVVASSEELIKNQLFWAGKKLPGITD